MWNRFDRFVASSCLGLGLILVAADLSATDPCAGGGSLTPSTAVDGIGGTGLQESVDGIGGTGHQDTESESGGIGGTGVQAAANSADGIGGTGRSSGDPDEGGIGGTGVYREADSGIVGVVTGFASICVGGREIHYDSETPVTIDGARSPAAVLAVGQVVEIAATSTSNALLIRVRHEVEGEVSAVDTARNQVTVLGQTVLLKSTTWTDFENGPALAEAAMFNVGDQVRVGGFRDQSDAVVASRVEVLDTAVPGLRGTVRDVGEDFVVVSGVRVRAANLLSARVGDQLRVEGVWDGSALQARRVIAEPALPFGGRIEKLQLEGIVRPSNIPGRVEIGGVGVDTSGSLSALQIGRRVRVEARVRDGVAIADRVVPQRPRVPPSHRGARPAPAPAGNPGSPRSALERARPKARARAAARPNTAVRVQRPQRVERPQRPVRPQRPERPPRPERPVRPRRPRPPRRR